MLNGESRALGIGIESPQNREALPSPGGRCSMEPSVAYGPLDRTGPSSVGALLTRQSCAPATGLRAFRAALALWSRPLVSRFQSAPALIRPRNGRSFWVFLRIRAWGGIQALKLGRIAANNRPRPCKGRGCSAQTEHPHTFMFRRPAQWPEYG